MATPVLNELSYQPCCLSFYKLKVIKSINSITNII